MLNPMNNSRPNIILIMTDQQQARACAREGFPLDTTPHLDHMARQGTWFNKAYTPTPLCGPARVSLFTGRYPTATGIRGNQIQPPRTQADIVDVFKQAGYQTAMVGKNHTHITEERFDTYYEHGHQGAYLDKGNAAADRRPIDIEFDEWLRGLHHWIADKPTPFPLECQSPYRLISAAQRWIEDAKDGAPFFMHLSINEPHNPYQVPEPYFSMFRGQDLPPIYGNKGSYKQRGFKWEVTGKLQRQARDDFDQRFDDYRANYYGMCRLIDDQIKRFEAYLETAGLLDNTLLVFVSDHGDFVGDYGLMRKGPGLPDTLCRIPFFVKGPGILANPEPHDAHVNLVDLLPTFCEWADVEIPLGVQGKSLAPLLRGEAVPESEFDTAYCETGYGGQSYTWDDQPDLHRYITPNEITFNELNQYSLGGSMRMVRHQDWKLISDNEGIHELYNLIDDPAELNNRFADTDPESVNMRGLLLQKMAEKLIQNEDPLSNITPTSEPDQLKRHPHNYGTSQSA